MKMLIKLKAILELTAHVRGAETFVVALLMSVFASKFYSRRSFSFPFLEAHRALELLEDYHSKLNRPQDKQLRTAIERVIRIFKSRLFQALLGKLLYFSYKSYFTTRTPSIHTVK